MELKNDHAEGATKELDNLENVAINASLIPDTRAVYDLGSDTLHWGSIYAGETGGFVTLIGSGLVSAEDGGLLISANPTNVGTKFYLSVSDKAEDNYYLTISDPIGVGNNLMQVGDAITLTDLDVSGNWIGDLTFASSGTLQTSKTVSDTLEFQAYDSDGTSYTTFATLTTGNTPTMTLAGAVTGVTQSVADNTTKLATTAYVDAAGETRHMQLKNTSGGQLVLGDLVTLKAVAAGNEITTTTSQGDDLIWGMVNATIEDAATGSVQVLGSTTALKVDGTADIAIGDFIGTFTTAKIGMKAAAGDMAIAIALEAYTTDDSAGVIDALLITPRKI